MERPRWPSGKVLAMDRRVAGSTPDSTEDPSCIGPIACKIIRRTPNVLPLVWCGILKRGCHLRCRPVHLTEVQNYKVCHNIALVLLQNGTLILLNYDDL
ncbi:hypothetical protein AVEN_141426-1 [Araneus ventricosus]|uniref:Uncharacterized protein n=1 Tax=Araneus ventricosus TaxID=182803 RepID=A0A4Y2JVM2_ARAVE|nr:hypothetical protein AVEN_141426-1 [Araneus ventricosus]